eukprot:CAMPEP_0119425508 /NCGR_PEP_ID=MMETSP1335-20130426/34589_1 /TAXON_ID=259385 /ORGANISM="Chrysoculter rhomboideus, Strain RCC1486" /LENGTH=386 /DNA_ID=CAMNT_0007451077 /DNA_START=42 /DNA_END=1202 /DNA_ORIENTATION=-
MTPSSPQQSLASLASVKPTPGLMSLACNWQFVMLALVCVQNAAFSLLRRYVTAVVKDEASTSSMLALQELLKLVFSLGMMARDDRTWIGASERHSLAAFIAGHSDKMLVPASIFLCMNILGFISLAHIPAGLFAVLQQCKLLTTAVLSRVLLSRQLSYAKWRALLLLLAGVVLITYEGNRLAMEAAGASPGGAHGDGAHEHARFLADAVGAPLQVSGADESVTPGSTLAAVPVREEETQQERVWASMLVGVSAVLLEALLSGFATVYFEKVVKSTPLTIWHRNVQLAAWSLCIFVPMSIMDSPSNPLHGWGLLQLANGVVGAAGGLLVALAIVNFDSVIKSVAVAASIVLTVLLGHVLLAGPMSLPIAIASVVVIIATIDYTFSPS